MAPIPAGTTGTFPALNKQGRRRRCRRHRRAGSFAADLGQSQARLRYLAAGAGDLFAGDLEQRPDLQSADLSDVDGDGHADLRRASPAFASNKYTWDQTHLSNAVSLKSDTKGVFDFDLSASSYNYLQDILLNPLHGDADGRRLFARTARSRATTARTGRTPMPRASGVLTAMTVRRRSASASTATAIVSTIRSTLSSVWYATSSTGTGQLYSDGRRRNPYRRPVAAGRLEDRSRI